MYAPSMRVRGPEDSPNFFTIQFKHIPTKKTAFFEGWVTTFSDNFSSQWNEVPVYGRMAPLSTFMRTSRKIQLAFDVPSDDGGGAQINLQAVNDLITFLYPVYEQQAGTDKQRVGQTIQAAPLIGLKWTNLIADPTDNSELIGYLDGVNYAPKIEDGGFIRLPGGAFQAADFDKFGRLGDPNILSNAQVADLSNSYTQRIYIPKTLSINLNFTVLHKHLPGWIMSQSKDGGYIFGNSQANGGFPNTQAAAFSRQSMVLAPETTSAAYYDADDNVVAVTRPTQLEQEAAGAVLVKNSQSEL